MGIELKGVERKKEIIRYDVEVRSPDALADVIVAFAYANNVIKRELIKRGLMGEKYNPIGLRIQYIGLEYIFYIFTIHRGLYYFSRISMPDISEKLRRILEKEEKPYVAVRIKLHIHREFREKYGITPSERFYTRYYLRAGEKIAEMRGMSLEEAGRDVLARRPELREIIEKFVEFFELPPEIL